MRAVTLERCVKLALILQTKRQVTGDELVAATGASRRTIFRDLRVLAQAGLRHRYDRSQRTYHVSEDATLPSVELSRGAATGQILATSVLASLGILQEDQAVDAATTLRLRAG